MWIDFLDALFLVFMLALYQRVASGCLGLASRREDWQAHPRAWIYLGNWEKP
jgi:hypothetical protein